MKKVRLNTLGKLVTTGEVLPQQIVFSMNANGWWRVAVCSPSSGAGTICISNMETLNTSIIFTFAIGAFAPIFIKSLNIVLPEDRIIGARVLSKPGSQYLIDIRQNTGALMQHKMLLSNNNGSNLVTPFQVNDIPVGYTATEFMF